MGGKHPTGMHSCNVCVSVFTICNSSCGKVMFSQVSVILSTGGGGCGKGGGMCGEEGVHGKGGACMVKGGHVWQGGACMAKGACVVKVGRAW